MVYEQTSSTHECLIVLIIVLLISLIADIAVRHQHNILNNEAAAKVLKRKTSSLIHQFYLIV